MFSTTRKIYGWSDVVEELSGIGLLLLLTILFWGAALIMHDDFGFSIVVSALIPSPLFSYFLFLGYFHSGSFQRVRFKFINFFIDDPMIRKIIIWNGKDYTLVSNSD